MAPGRETRGPRLDRPHRLLLAPVGPPRRLRPWTPTSSVTVRYNKLSLEQNLTIKYGRDLAEWLERLTANAVLVTTVLGSIPASSDTVESEGRQMKSVE